MTNRTFRGDLLGYVGGERFHDASVQRVIASQGEAEILLKDEDGHLFKTHFMNVDRIQSNHPEGMLLYGLAELKAPPPQRRFVFVNWNESDDSLLDITAQGYEISEIVDW